MKYTIGTRGSKLAMAQTEAVCVRLREAYPEHEFEICVVRTKGDKIQDKPLNQIGDNGLFVREIEEKILAGELDIGVHSMKDMPVTPAEGLVFAKTWKREDPRDVLVLREAASLDELPEGAVIATGSIRRSLQIRKLRPDIRVTGIRGNVDTRLRKMEEQELDGIILAAAGLHRLGMRETVTVYLEPDEMIPAPAQGALALELREDNVELKAMLDALSDRESDETVAVERCFLEKTGSSCHVPVGAFCDEQENGMYRLRAFFGNESGTRTKCVTVTGHTLEKLAEEAWLQIRPEVAGKVILVGAGPGDPGLITVKGMEALREADCIIYDRLVSPQLLEEAKQGCELVYVGKEAHHHTMEQEEINRLLVKKAMQYEKTVRLKGGDVYVFGRGGEEGLELFRQGIRFEVIPGLSSAIAGPACAGIPVTHRGISGGFHVVTAHDKRDKLADIDFEAMAGGGETCIFLMGLGCLEEIREGLLGAGMPPDTPAAVISNASTNKQKVCVSQLGSIVEGVRQEGLISPALVVVGEVVKLRQWLDVIPEKALSGKRFLVPKNISGISRMTKLLWEQGAEVEEIQLGRIVKKELHLSEEELSGVDWFVFTSRNGARAFRENLFRSGMDARSLAGAQIAAVGKKTEEALNSYGIRADLVPEHADSTALAETLAGRLGGTETVWHIRAENGEHEIQRILGGVCHLKEVAVYENVPENVGTACLPECSGFDGIVFTCGSLVRRLTALYQEEFAAYSREHTMFSIGKKTTAVLKEQGVEQIREASDSSYESLVEEICRFFKS